MSNPRIEEVYDDASDPDEMDLDAFDFARPGQTTLQQAQQQQSQPQAQQQPNADMMAQMQQMLSGGGMGGGGMPPQMDQKERMRLEREQQEKSKSYQCIYPIYFDASRSREEGRRVGKDLAVKNPLARDIVDALQQISAQVHVALQIVFEPSKCHPKDWANPGRVKILLKKDGKPVTAKIANSEFLLESCATGESMRRLANRLSRRTPPLQDDRYVPQIAPYHRTVTSETPRPWSTDAQRQQNPGSCNSSRLQNWLYPASALTCSVRWRSQRQHDGRHDERARRQWWNAQHGWSEQHDGWWWRTAGSSRRSAERKGWQEEVNEGGS
jgi:signal recognition particle subunit SEC65